MSDEPRRHGREMTPDDVARLYTEAPEVEPWPGDRYCLTCDTGDCAHVTDPDEHGPPC